MRNRVNEIKSEKLLAVSRELLKTLFNVKSTWFKYLNPRIKSFDPKRRIWVVEVRLELDIGVARGGNFADPLEARIILDENAKVLSYVSFVTWADFF
jgi:hypothetical protein